MNTRIIVAVYLEQIGFDGLYQPGECACKKDDLFPCDILSTERCEPGYLTECDCGDHDFHIGPEKTAIVDVCAGDA